MYSTSEKHKTQIDFTKLGFSSHSQTDILSPKRNDLENEAQNGLKPLKLVKAAQSNISVHEYIQTTHGSPWETYEKSYDIRLGLDNTFVTVVERKDTQYRTTTRRDPLSDFALVRRFSGQKIEDKLYKFQEIKHPNIVSPFELFKSKGTNYVALEYMAYSLHYVTGNPHLNEIRLAAIIGPVGLSETVIKKIY
jgi:hypothetical protein